MAKISLICLLNMLALLLLIHITNWHPKIRDGCFHIKKVGERPSMMGNFKVGFVSTWY